MYEVILLHAFQHYREVHLGSLPDGCFSPQYLCFAILKYKIQMHFDVLEETP